MAEKKTEAKAETGPKTAVTEVPSGWCEVEFTKNFGSYKKGDKATYHKSTINALAKKDVIKVAKELTQYVPKEAKK